MTETAVLIAPRFFGYEREITAGLARAGYGAIFIDERPSNRSVAKAIFRVQPKALEAFVSSYYRSVLSRLSRADIRFVLIIKGEIVPTWVISALRADHPRAKFVFYDFDSFRRNPRGLIIAEACDAAFSFDSQDVHEHSFLRYLPLFFSPQFFECRSSGSRSYDLAFVGTVHSGRYGLVQYVMQAGRNNFAYYYSPAQWHFAMEKLTTRDVRRIPWRSMSFEKLSLGQVADVFGQSRVVIDAQRTLQTGLTMRTFEALAAGARLITTNRAIESEPFFDPRWIFVLPDCLTDVDFDALRRFVAASDEPPAERVASYSIESWLGTLLAASNGR